MKLHEPQQHRAPTQSPSTLSLCSEFTILWLLVLMIQGSLQVPNSWKLRQLLIEPRSLQNKWCKNLVQMNLFRVRALRTYKGTRTYRVEYHGFPDARSAVMVVKVSYLSPAEKEFIVQSTAGSSPIIDRVFKKAGGGGSIPSLATI
jgi:hypothetical protein